MTDPREIIARQVNPAAFRKPRRDLTTRGRQDMEHYRAAAFDVADKAIAALAEAGFVICRKELVE